MAVSEDASEVTTTYGARGGKIRIGGTAELTVPADAVETGTNFTLGLNTGKDQLKITPYKGQVGDLYRIGVKRPDGPVGQVASAGSPFLLKLPLPKGTKTANLVIAVATGGKTGKYGVFPPKSIEEGDTSYAVFELPNIVPEAMIHLTSAAPSP